MTRLRGRAPSAAPCRPAAISTGSNRSDLHPARVAGECANRCVFSGGKDSIVLLRLAEKAFRPANSVPTDAHRHRHISEVIAFRDMRAAELHERLIVRSSRIRSAAARSSCAASTRAETPRSR